MGSRPMLGHLTTRLWEKAVESLDLKTRKELEIDQSASHQVKSPRPPHYPYEK
jgi:hypothetical protein